MKLNLADVRYFAEVAATLNLTQAAKRLGITQPALSVAMRRIEDAVGAPLLNRRHSGVQLTRAGVAFNERAADLIARWEALTKESARHHDELVGRVLIGCHPSLAMAVLPRFLPGLIRAFPHVEIGLSHDISPAVTDDVYNSRVDFGIVAEPLDHQDLVIRELLRGFVCFCGHREDAARRDFSGAVLFCDESLFQTRMLLRAAERRRISFRRRVHTPRLDVVAVLVDAGAGIGILPWPATAQLRVDRVQTLERLPRVENRICLVYRRDGGSRALRPIARYIEQHARTSG